jgi:hypothetical protein
MCYPLTAKQIAYRKLLFGENWNNIYKLVNRFYPRYRDLTKPLTSEVEKQTNNLTP